MIEWINFFKSIDDGENWIPIPKEEVPDPIKEDEPMERMLQGEGAYYQDAWYIVMRNESAKPH